MKRKVFYNGRVAKLDKPKGRRPSELMRGYGHVKPSYAGCVKKLPKPSTPRPSDKKIKF